MTALGMNNVSGARLVGAVGGFLGTVGSLLIIFSYVLFKPCRTEWRKLLCFLSITDLMQGIYYLQAAMIPTETDAKCLFDIIFGTCSACSSFLWTSCLSFYVYQLIQITLDPDRHKNDCCGTGHKHLIMWFHIISFGYPTVMAVLLALLYYPQSKMSDNMTASFGCFISHRSPVWRMVALYGPLLLSWVYTSYLYTRASYKIRWVQQEVNPTHTHLRSIRRRMLLIPLVFVFLRYEPALIHMLLF
jgi:hypothetical protein